MPGQKAPEDLRREEILKAAYRVAARDRLEGLTVRHVAAEAGVSNGLVFFYFESRDGLLLALLDWLLERTIVAAEVVDPAAHGGARDGMLAVLARDIERLPAQRERVALFFDFWVMGTRHPDVQRRIRAALDRYRDGFRPLARAVVAAEPQRYRDVTPEALAAAAAGFIEGCALQLVMDPERFDVAELVATMRALVG